MMNFLSFSQIIVSILLIFIVLIQNKNVALNLSSMSGGMGEVSKRWPEKVLHNITIILGVIFVVNAITLFLLSK